jgi:hypothetical protein
VKRRSTVVKQPAGLSGGEPVTSVEDLKGMNKVSNDAQAAAMLVSVQCKHSNLGYSKCLEHARVKGLDILSSRRVCIEENCEKRGVRNGYCLSHAKAHKFINKPGASGVCKEAGCVKFIVKRGYCQTHAKAHGVEIKAKTCMEEGCNRVAKKRGGYCPTHAELDSMFADHESNIGGFCTAPGGCSRRKVSHGLCIQHGREAGFDFSYRICKSEGCEKFISKKGYCRSHARELGLLEG